MNYIDLCMIKQRCLLDERGKFGNRTVALKVLIENSVQYPCKNSVLEEVLGEAYTLKSKKLHAYIPGALRGP